MVKINWSKIQKPATALLDQLKTQRKKIAQLSTKEPKFASLLLITIVLSLFIIFGTLTPSMQTFEGTLNLTHLTFTSNTRQLFLKNARSITEISAQNALPLTLTGTFSGNVPQLKTLNKITLQPIKDQQTWWQMESENIEITKLELTATTTIKNLTYDSYNERLSLEILPGNPHPTLIINPSNALNLSFNGYQIPQLNQSVNSLTWQPDNQITLTISQPIQLELKFKNPHNNAIFWGILSVKKVDFNQVIIASESYDDNYAESAIAGGTVRLADKNYTLEEGQFLTFKPVDSISSLLRLKITQESAPTLKTSDNKTIQINEPFQGLKVDISGKTKRIDIGLNKNLPVAYLQASLLEGWMPRDAAIASITFLTSLVIMLIGWLWELIVK